MENSFEPTAQAAPQSGLPIRLTFLAIVVAGIASWALVLGGVYVAWKMFRAFAA